MAAIAVLLLLPAVVYAGKGKKKPPKFSVIREAVYRHFAVEGIDRHEIITQGETKPLFKLLNQMGWNVPGRKVLLERVPEDRSLLVRQLRTKSGRKLMQKIAQYPEGYDRLDRLSRMPHGRKILVALVRGPDGYKMIEYLTSTSGGAEMGKMLSRIKNNEHFNKPTGRIYTPEHLVKALQQLYDENRSGDHAGASQP